MWAGVAGKEHHQIESPLFTARLSIQRRSDVVSDEDRQLARNVHGSARARPAKLAGSRGRAGGGRGAQHQNGHLSAAQQSNGLGPGVFSSAYTVIARYVQAHLSCLTSKTARIADKRGSADGGSADARTQSGMRVPRQTMRENSKTAAIITRTSVIHIA